MNTSTPKLYAFFLVLLLQRVVHTATTKYAIIADFGGVIGLLNRGTVFQSVLQNMRKRDVIANAHIFIDWKRIPVLYRTILDRIGTRGSVPAHDGGASNFGLPSYMQLHLAKGSPFASGQYEFQSGTISYEQLIEAAQKEIALLKQQGVFKNNFEATLIEQLIIQSHRPDGLTPAYKLNKEFLKFFTAAQPNTSQGIKLPKEGSQVVFLILSNFNKAQFDSIATSDEFASLFAHIPTEHQFISGKCKSDIGLKPSSSSFDRTIRHCAQELAIPAERIIFCDDQLENCMGMLQCLIAAGVDPKQAIHNVYWIQDPIKSVRAMMHELVERGIVAAPAKEDGYLSTFVKRVQTSCVRILTSKL